MKTPPPQRSKSTKTHFESIAYVDLPSGRRGKHHVLLLQVLDDLTQLEEGHAIKIPLADFAGTVADMRSAISRAAKKRNIEIATSSDENYFYLWKPEREVYR